MAKKISQLTQATEVKSDDVTVIVQDGETKKLPLNMMLTKEDIENKKVAGLAKLDEIEATYENDTYTPTITVKNKSSVKVGEGDGVDYSANVMDGHAKSAILRGQTLVNLASQCSEEIVFNRSWQSFRISNDIIKGGLNDKEQIYMSMEIYIHEINIAPNNIRIVTHKGTGGYDVNVLNDIETLPLKTWVKVSTIRNVDASLSTQEYGMSFCVYGNHPTTNGEQIAKASVRNPMWVNLSKVYGFGKEPTKEEFDKNPYFEGMSSVKMPVLKTTGKNLFDGEMEIGGIDDYGLPTTSTSLNRTKKYIEVEPNTNYSLSRLGSISFDIFYYDENKNFISKTTWLENKKTPINCKYVKFATRSLIETDIQIQFEQSINKTTYEPYKSNILSTTEDVTLRGIGEVKDTLDCLTGKVTERVGEIVLDGSENWTSTTGENTNTIRFKWISNLNPKLDFASLPIKCDKFKNEKNGETDTESIQLWGATKEIMVRISKTKATTVDEFKQWLSQNQVTLQYELATPVIKTVDLMPSGTHPSTTPYCWKNGHIQLSSSGLLPNLEYSVVTSRAGQINQNATMIVKNDKRIFDLEILLAGGLVNTTYQALTLQNQVETGLSKVSLNLETEPDYLLYHMIMKLIEEKAYKLDDLTEKVSVFYLYEKLSDEQFETIYSALYPFVEDEIVEEPVVEELPEVVEDEVIM